jgi:hypothetical protein
LVGRFERLGQVGEVGDEIAESLDDNTLKVSGCGERGNAKAEHVNTTSGTH